MKREEITVQAKLKPNCGLENTRASLVMRRIAPLCDSATCHPHAIKSSRETIPYLRDHGLFVTFVSRTPERVLAAISGAFFVDSCTIVEDPEGIPPFEMPSAPQEDDAENGGIEAISSFADRDARSERDEKLSNLIAQLEETNRSLRAHAESLPNDRVLSDIAFSYAQTLDHLRSTVALSRIEAFDRIAPSLHKLVEDYGRSSAFPSIWSSSKDAWIWIVRCSHPSRKRSDAPFDHVSATASKAPRNAPTWENRNAQPYACAWKTKARMSFAASSTTAGPSTRTVSPR